ncbi:hypothetical protein McanCB56680_007800 [Microsporum canis]
MTQVVAKLTACGSASKPPGRVLPIVSNLTNALSPPPSRSNSQASGYTVDGVRNKNREQVYGPSWCIERDDRLTSEEQGQKQEGTGQ